MKKIKLGVLGVSNHFINRIIAPIKKSDIVELYAISSRSNEKVTEVSKKYNIPKCYDSYDELLGDRSIDMVFIPLPNHIHAEWIKKTADAGKHILCEKPIALCASEAKDAVDYALNKGVKIMEAFMYKFHPQWTESYKMVKDGKIGKLQTIHTFFSYNNKNPEDIRNIDKFGGGAIFDIGCYAVSTARFIFGKEPIRVVGIKSIDNNFKTDILSSGILDFGEERALFTVATQSYPFQKVELHGTDGIITIEVPFNPDPDKKTEIVLMSNSNIKKIVFDPVDHYKIQFEKFAQSIIENKDVPFSPYDAINNTKVIDALFRSSQSNNWEIP